MELAPATDRAPAVGLFEPMVTFAVATALASALYWTARVVPVVAQNLHGAIAVIFLYAPTLAVRLSGRPFEYAAGGLTVHPLRLNAAILGVAVLATWPFFIAAFFWFYGWICQAPQAADLLPPQVMSSLAELFAPMCGRWLGFGGGRLVLPADFLLLAFTQIIVIALPEELFFRGYLYARFEARWPSRRRLLGAPVGAPLLVSAIFFGLGHVLVDFDPQRFSVILPGLVFGWMRARTGSLAPGILFHALCNLFSESLHTSFFR